MTHISVNFKKLLLIAGFISFMIGQAAAQELNLTIQVIHPRLQIADPQIFENMKKEVTNFFNNTKWTEDEYEEFEKIEGNLNITITEELSATSFTADFALQGIRPVYNSNYKTQTLNYVDKGISFGYRENQPILNSRSNFIDPLSSLLTYYAYLLVGFDHDTFSSFGGDSYFQLARNIISNIPNGVAAGTGWDSNTRSNTSRFNVIDNLLDPRVRPYRQAIYEYHIQSLDQMHEDPGKSRAVMLSAITAIGEVNRAVLNSGILQMFSDCKREEIIQIFIGGDRGQQSKVYDIMVAVDPARATDYAKIR